MGLASYFFTKNVDRTWRLLENLETGMIGMLISYSDAASVGKRLDLVDMP
jgi:succinate-semialdehyde dehydrogenase/glutarate-semialdehyde dehydrogenase